MESRVKRTVEEWIKDAIDHLDELFLDTDNVRLLKAKLREALVLCDKLTAEDETP
jgi:hypothetical protein